MMHSALGNIQSEHFMTKNVSADATRLALSFLNYKICIFLGMKNISSYHITTWTEL